jgi:glycosyltransferase involved in cell wall biosynthesis
MPYLVMSSNFDRNNYVNSKITFSVYDHLLLSLEDRQAHKYAFNYIADGYTVSSEKLLKIYSELPEYQKPTMTIEDTVDPALFYPVNEDRLQEQNRTLFLGWAGNSKWMSGLDCIDHKGFRTIVKPTLAALQREGVNVAGRFADSNERRIPLEEMVHYYNSIDVFICASDIEGTPNPVLEAMACGVPVISTDVGVVPQVFGPLQREFILKERTPEALRERIEYLVNNPEMRMALSEENLRQMKNWTREEESKKWDQFFQKMLSISADEMKQVVIGDKTLTLPRRALKEIFLDMPYQPLLKRIDDLENSLSWKITKPLRRLAEILLRKS